jgi:hypothetical protein
LANEGAVFEGVDGGGAKSPTLMRLSPSSPAIGSSIAAAR